MDLSSRYGDLEVISSVFSFVYSGNFAAAASGGALQFWSLGSALLEVGARGKTDARPKLVRAPK